MFLATDLTRHCENDMKGVPGVPNIWELKGLKNSTHRDDVLSYRHEVKTL